MRKIYQVYGQDAHEMTLKLLEAADGPSAWCPQAAMSR